MPATPHPLDAPIVPGEDAARIRLGMPIAEALRVARAITFAEEPVINACIQAPTGITRYASPALDLWAEDGRIIQLLARTGYSGRIHDAIALGATQAEIEAALGPITDDASGNPAIAALPGMSFELDDPPRGQPAASARLRAIYIFSAEDDRS